MHHASSSQKRKDFWIAFVAWLGTNAVAIVIIQVVSSASGQDNSGTVSGALSFLLVLVNAAAVAVLAVMRRYAALGVGAAVATSFWVAVLEGFFLVISIFAGGYDATYLRSDVVHGSIEVTYAFLVAALIVSAVGAFPALRTIDRRIR
jgi:uncharacterized membrane protein YhaH (DUF805 family)